LVAKNVWSEYESAQRQPFESLAEQVNKLNQIRGQITEDNANMMGQINTPQAGNNHNHLVDEFYNGAKFKNPSLPSLPAGEMWVELLDGGVGLY